jgi:hypothetical protein
MNTIQKYGVRSDHPNDYFCFICHVFRDCKHDTPNTGDEVKFQPSAVVGRQPCQDRNLPGMQSGTGAGWPESFMVHREQPGLAMKWNAGIRVVGMDFQKMYGHRLKN